ncbi:Mfa1 family fimbria major subunit [Bacteroides nordii]|uniref:Mfa1 family fimbria major subunit n=1 Tax=Bacteroides nordii TaxID=291645 RepID=UPI002A82BB84|nr:Mfa1 family fimbria major subunit [Bacteroides nordii]
MKLRSLFLAGLAVMAMASCSNEDDAIVNGGENAAKDAALQFSIGFPQTTRATTASGDKSDEGLSCEQKVNTISFVLKYNDNTPTAVYDFDNNTEAAPGFTQEGLIIKTEKVEVNSGIAKIFVFINPVTKITTENYANLQETATYSNMDDLGDIANPKDSKFLMFGEGSCTIKGGQDNEADVTVSRIAAKLAEQTAKDKEFTIENSTDKFGSAIKVKLSEYSYVNLNKTTNVTNSTTIFTPANTGYFQYFKEEQAYQTFDELTTIKEMNVEEANKVTYCLENNNAAAPTMILYKAQITEFPNYTEGNNFYIDADGILYPSFDVMNAKDGKFFGQLTNKEIYTGIDNQTALSDNSSYEDFNKYGIQKYTKGICYYRAEIKTGAETKIVHNNYYKLSVSKITELGDPGTNIPTPGNPLTYLKLNITVAPWTVWNNDIIL